MYEIQLHKVKIIKINSQRIFTKIIKIHLTKEDASLDLQIFHDSMTIEKISTIIVNKSNNPYFYVRESITNDTKSGS